jgi:hypothetical protein
LDTPHNKPDSARAGKRVPRRIDLEAFDFVDERPAAAEADVHL